MASDTIQFNDINGTIILEYCPARQGRDENWVTEAFKKAEWVTINRTFHFHKTDVVYEDEWEIHFKFAVKYIENGIEFFKISGQNLGIGIDVYFEERIDLDKKFFVAENNVSIFGRIDELIKEDIFIYETKPEIRLRGEPEEAREIPNNYIPISDFRKLIKTFPTVRQLRLYSETVIQDSLGEYLETMTDSHKKLEDFLRQKEKILKSYVGEESKIPVPDFDIEPPKIIAEYETEKFEFVRDELKELISKYGYGRGRKPHETEFRRKIAELILIIFPKYIRVIEEVPIPNYYGGADKSADMCLIDADGHIDILEIKLPKEDILVSIDKSHDNWVPKRELSSAIMQAEKYVFHMTKGGKTSEDKIAKYCSKKKINLPSGLEIKVTSPKTMLIIGFSSKLSSNAKRDFEVIRRKYSNMLDIITYDDLIARVERIIENFRKVP
ncbi:MAG: DUF4263 domain-containing protein [Caulobacterales bacterium]|nr:DUF4263 domain-containing protein [Caulobacterales bacterium]